MAMREVGQIMKLKRIAAILAAVVGASILSGCIADTAEDTELPWASNKNWEGIAPIAPTLMDRYE
ncbi:MAG: hypothetical protein J6R80_06595 [Kiritimatiellae bacterium]|jgi:hypothetical protein|nr:hypothetical protein [Kiritimatiellia bacterium]